MRYIDLFENQEQAEELVSQFANAGWQEKDDIIKTIKNAFKKGAFSDLDWQIKDKNTGSVTLGTTINDTNVTLNGYKGRVDKKSGRLRLKSTVRMGLTLRIGNNPPIELKAATYDFDSPGEKRDRTHKNLANYVTKALGAGEAADSILSALHIS